MSKVRIRSDNYNSQKGLIIEGTAVRPTNYGEEEVEQSFPFCDENVYELYIMPFGVCYLNLSG